MLTHNTTKIDTPIKLIIKINIVANEEGFIFIKWDVIGYEYIVMGIDVEVIVDAFERYIKVYYIDEKTS